MVSQVSIQLTVMKIFRPLSINDHWVSPGMDSPT